MVAEDTAQSSSPWDDAHHLVPGASWKALKPVALVQCPGWGPALAGGQSLSVTPTPRDAKGQLEDSRAGELATYLQENLEAMQLAGELAQQETQGALELVRPLGRGRAHRVPLPGGRHTQPHPLQLREKSQALEVSVAELVRQVKDLSDHFLALSWRLDLQEQTLSMRLREASTRPAALATGPTAPGPERTGSTKLPAQQPPPRGSLSSFSNSFIEVQGTQQSTFSECVIPWFFVRSELYKHYHGHF